MIIGDMPPYEAFPIGGTNSVRGYSEGGTGTGRNYVAGTAELHVPLVSPVEVIPDLPCTILYPRMQLFTWLGMTV